MKNHFAAVKNHPWKTSFIAAACAAVLTVGVAGIAQLTLVGRQADSTVVLPNGQTITPAGTQIEVNDRPLAIAVSPDGTLAAVATASNFDSRSLYIINLATQSIAQTIAINNSF